MKVAIVSLIKNEARQPPVGLLRIAGYIKHHMNNVEVRLIDEAFENVFDEIEKFRPDIIGLQTYTSYYSDCINFSNKMKELYPNIKTIIGGPHITTLPESLHKTFDFAVLGMGEARFVNLIEGMRTDKIPTEMDGLVYWKNGKLKINIRIENNEMDLDQTVSDYSLLHKNYFKKRYIFEINDFQPYMGIISSLGCPYDCIFCSVRAEWGNIKYREIERVMTEIKELYHKYGVKHIEFYDDLFALNKKRLRLFYDELKKANLLGKITFSAFARADAFDDELCVLLKRINFKSITFGFESGSERILKFIKNNPRSTLEHNKNAIRLCRKHGLNVSGGIVTGNPTEKIDDFKENLKFIDFAWKNGATRIWIQILVPFPKTLVWDVGVKENKIPQNYEEVDWNSMQIHNRDNPLFLDNDVSYQDFIRYYEIAKKKCRLFVYKNVLLTLYKNPLNIFNFLNESRFYKKRLDMFVSQ